MHETELRAKTLLELFRYTQTEDLDDISPLISIAKNALRRVRSFSPPTPTPDSPAMNVFDTHVTRRLHTIAPIRPIDLPEQESVWRSLTILLDGWEHITQLRSVHSLGAWKVRATVCKRPPWLIMSRLQAHSTSGDQKHSLCIHTSAR